MLYLVPIILILWSLGWTLRKRLAPPWMEKKGAGQASGLSVIIPARNEAHNLPRLLDSITSQANPPLEVIVVDDGSTDGTSEIAANHGARVITSATLPAGWRGKTWACHQGAMAAKGQHLIFLDADTWFAVDGLDRLLDHYQGGALSVGPWHAVQKPWESLSLFFNLAMVIGTVPDGLFGQALIIDRSSYQKIGGHEAVKSKILENVHLKEHLDEADVPCLSIPGHRLIHFRMYPNGIGEMIEGWTKGFASGAGRTAKVTLVTMILWMTGLMAVVLMPLFVHESLLCATLYGIHALQVGWLARKAGSFPWWSALLYPLPLIFFFLIFTRSAYKGGRNVTWKGRTIDAD